MEYLTFIVFSLAIVTACVGQTVDLSPVNTAAKSGEETRLNCSASFTSPERLEWRLYQTDDGGTRIWINDADPPIEGYRVESNGDRHDLIVDAMSAARAGRYVCRLVLSDEKGEAELVLVSDSTCDPVIQEPPYDPDPPEIIDGAIMLFTCDVSYTGYKAPMLEWYNMAGRVSDQQYELDEEEMIVRATANVSATYEQDEMIYECRVSFVREDSEATPPPTYTDTCISYYQVIHAPQNLEIHPDPSDYPDGVITLEVGDLINCSASGRPEPDILWFDTNGDGGLIEGAVLPITEERVGDQNWTCRASNMVAQVPRSVEMSVQFYAAVKDLPGANDPNAGANTGGGTEPWVIAVATIIPLLIVGTVVIVGVFFVMRRKREKGAGSSGKQKPPLGKEYENKAYPHNGAPDEPGPPHRQTSIPPPRDPVSGNPRGNVPKGGIPVMPMTQQGYPGKASPGYADLGVKAISGSAASSLNVSHDSIQVSRFMGDERRPSHTPSQASSSVAPPPGRHTPQQQMPPQQMGGRQTPQQGMPGRMTPQMNPQGPPGGQVPPGGRMTPQMPGQGPPQPGRHQPSPGPMGAPPQQRQPQPPRGPPRGYQPPPGGYNNPGYGNQGYQPSPEHASPYAPPPGSDTVV